MVLGAQSMAEMNETMNDTTNETTNAHADMPAGRPVRRVTLNQMEWDTRRKSALVAMIAIMMVNAVTVFIVVLFYALGRTMEYAAPLPSSVPFLNVCWFFIFTTPIALLTSLFGSWASFFAGKYKLAFSLAPIPLINALGSYSFLLVADAINGIQTPPIIG